MAAERAKEAIKAASDQLKRAIDARTLELLSELDHVQSEIQTGAKSEKELAFKMDSSLLTSCQSFGQIYEHETVCPIRCHVTGESVHQGTVDQASYIELHLITKDGTECTDDTENIPVDVTLVNINGEVECTGERHRTNGSIVIFRYVPMDRGEHQLNVKVLGQPVRGSPFNTLIDMPLKLMCIPKGSFGSYYQPGGLAVGPGGELAVIDSRGYKTVNVYNNNMDLVLSTGAWGSGRGQCWLPVGVTFDLAGNLLVSDGDNHRIHKFDRKGCHVMTVGEKGSGKMQFLRPTGIGVNKAGYVYVCDRINHRVQILKPNLTFDSSFGGYGQGPSNLYNPWDVAFDSQGLVYVCDPGHYCIKQFTPHGEFRSSIGPATTGEEKDELKHIQMMCIDKYDYIYVTDRDLNCVVVYDTDGKYHTRFGVYGTAVGQFSQPRGIAKGKDGSLFVSEVGNRRVQQFR